MPNGGQAATGERVNDEVIQWLTALVLTIMTSHDQV